MIVTVTERRVVTVNGEVSHEGEPNHFVTIESEWGGEMTLSFTNMGEIQVDVKGVASSITMPPETLTSAIADLARLAKMDAPDPMEPLKEDVAAAVEAACALIQDDGVATQLRTAVLSLMGEAS